MKIKSLGYTSVKLQFNNVEIIVDPVSAKKIGGSFPKTSGDVVLFTSADLINRENILEEEGLSDKVESEKRESVLEISNPGEYEVGEVFIRRPLLSNYYILDENDIRTVVIGLDSKDIKPEELKDLGDVDVLVIPGGDGDQFISYDKLEKIIAAIDPTTLVPVGFANDKVKVDNLKTSEEFIKHFGYQNVSEESLLKVTKGKEEDSKIMNVTLLS